MINSQKARKILINLGFAIAILMGIIILIHTVKWLVVVYMQRELTGPLCNFVFLLTLGLIFTIEFYIEYSYSLIYEMQLDYMPIVVGVIALITAIIFYFKFAFSGQFLNFTVILMLEPYGFFLIDLPRLIKAKRRIEYAQSVMPRK